MACEAILDVAVRQFGDRGFDGASTRSIAAAADTVMSSITYHFGSKEGLYLACADHIAGQIAERFRPTLAAVPPVETLSADQAINAVQGIIAGMVTLMMSDQSRDWSGFMIREQQNPGPAFDRLYAGVMEPVARKLVLLLRRARPDLDERAATALGLTLFGQALVLRAGRATVLRALGVEALDATDRTLLADSIHSNIDRILRSAPLS